MVPSQHWAKQKRFLVTGYFCDSSLLWGCVVREKGSCVTRVFVAVLCRGGCNKNVYFLISFGKERECVCDMGTSHRLFLWQFFVVHGVVCDIVFLLLLV